jgi:hypothetical protein
MRWLGNESEQPSGGIVMPSPARSLVVLSLRELEFFCGAADGLADFTPDARGARMFLSWESAEAFIKQIRFSTPYSVLELGFDDAQAICDALQMCEDVMVNFGIAKFHVRDVFMEHVPRLIKVERSLDEVQRKVVDIAREDNVSMNGVTEESRLLRRAMLRHRTLRPQQWYGSTLLCQVLDSWEFMKRGNPRIVIASIDPGTTSEELMILHEMTEKKVVETIYTTMSEEERSEQFIRAANELYGSEAAFLRERSHW